ncbi:MAG TPA: VUT family protein, partial [Longimicrobiaceae bacterium]
ARMKVLTEGRFLWMRTIGSTVVGEMVDSLIFYPAAFLGVWDGRTVLKVLFTNYLLKVVWEAVATPLTYRIVAFLKRREHEDWFDRDTDFTPFSLSVE